MAAQQLSESSERELERIRKTWPAAESHVAWQPKCVLVLHSTLAEYQHAISNPRDRSVGMTTFVVKQGEIDSRRIDLRSDVVGWESAALPHELTHLVLADTFRARPLPAWIAEGVAVLSECPHKLARRKIVLDRALAARGTIPVAQLLTQEGRIGTHSLDVFYSQSASLTEFLVRFHGIERFQKFVGKSQEIGSVAALREFYEIGDAGLLEQLWKSNLIAERKHDQTDGYLILER